jgi:hypothetical protein
MHPKTKKWRYREIAKALPSRWFSRFRRTGKRVPSAIFGYIRVPFEMDPPFTISTKKSGSGSTD